MLKSTPGVSPGQWVIYIKYLLRANIFTLCKYFAHSASEHTSVVSYGFGMVFDGDSGHSVRLVERVPHPRLEQ